MPHWIFTEEHEMFRKSVRKFVENEVKPHVEEWEEAGEVPRWLFKRCGELGYLGLKFPEEYGGDNVGLIMEAVFIEEFAKCGSGGVGAAIGAHSGIALMPIWRFGTDEQKKK